MNEITLAKLRESASTLRDAEQTLWGMIAEPAKDGSRFDLSQIIGGTELSLSDIKTILAALLDALSRLEEMQQIAFVPRSLLQRVSDMLGQISSEMGQMSGAITQRGARSFSETSSLTILGTSGAAYALGQNARNIASYIDQVLTDWLTLRSALRAPKFRDFSELFGSLGVYRDTMEDITDQAKNITNKISTLHNTLEENVEQSTEGASEIKRLLDYSTGLRDSLTDASSEASTKLSEIKSAIQSAHELSSSVDTYTTNLESFDQSISARIKKFQDESKRIDYINNKSKSQSQDIDRIIAQAESMLTGSTNAGLAHRFNEKHELISDELKKAARSFYYSIAALVVLSIPMILYILPPEFVAAIFPETLGKLGAWASSGIGHTPTDVLAQVLARALLLIPGIWLVRFTASRHAKLFRLREDYAYKYSIASSVEGFKKQAGKYSGEIAAASFFELIFNPACSMEQGGEVEKHPNPIFEKVMEKLEGRTEKEARVLP